MWFECGFKFEHEVWKRCDRHAKLTILVTQKRDKRALKFSQSLLEVSSAQLLEDLTVTFDSNNSMAPSRDRVKDTRISRNDQRLDELKTLKFQQQIDTEG